MHVISKGKIGNIATAMKCPNVMPGVIHISRIRTVVCIEDNGGQGTTVIEGPTADECDGVANGDGVKTCAIIEGLVADGSDRVGDRDRC